jgi:anti-anti-sigma factor
MAEHGFAEGGSRRSGPVQERDAPRFESGEASSGLEIGLQLTSETTFMWVRGEVDMLTLPQLAAELSGRLRDGSTVLVLDLQDVTFLSAGGLSVLLMAAEQARLSGITLRVLPSRAVAHVANLLGQAAALNLVS